MRVCSKNPFLIIHICGDAASTTVGGSLGVSTVVYGGICVYVMDAKMVAMFPVVV